MITDNFLETAAEAVHDAWAVQKRASGYHAPSECPINGLGCASCHPDLIPYNLLSELPYLEDVPGRGLCGAR